ncbi:MAG: hypothetical protein REI12_02885 [Pedobacter sp.]|nr:hypothetical protein [Pedobacter sp.]
MRLPSRVLTAFVLAGALAAPAFAASTTTAAPATASTGTTAMGMLAQLPAFLTKLDAMRGTALTVAEKATVTEAVTQGNNTVNGIQNKFLGGIASATGLDAATIGAIIPSATKPVSNSDLTSKLESKLGKKLGFMQSSGVKAANSLRNNSLDSLKTSLANGVASKVGMDPALITSMLPMLGF